MSRLCSSRFERAARKLGWMRIAGIDEAGRGALFGPVVAAAVILNPKRRIVGLDDSKKLTSERRAELAPRIREHALAWAVAEVDAQRIDAWNIYQASRQAMTAALQLLAIPPDYLLIDAMQLDVLIEQKSLIKAMGAASPSPQPRSSLKRIGTGEWKSGTPYIRNTAWRATRVTARPTISKPYASMAHRRSTAIPSLLCDSLPAGLPALLKRNFLSRFSCRFSLSVGDEQG